MKKLIFTFLLFFSLSSGLQADVAGGVLEKYPNPVFVGTGVRRCVNIARALNAEFVDIYTVDEDPVLVKHSEFVLPVFFNEKPRVTRVLDVTLGNPGTDLTKIIRKINQQITFLLCSYIPHPDHPERINTILQELDQIKAHSIKTHTILIENIHLAGTPLFGNITLDQVKAKLLEINPSYKFRYEKGGHIENEENAILAAYLF